MHPVLRCLVERFHASGTRCSIISAGAGGSAASALMAVPGCSSTLVSAQFPYHDSVTNRLLDYAPQSYVCADVGTSLAQVAFQSCLAAVPRGDVCIGIGATAAISTNRRRHGPCGAFVSCWSPFGATLYRVTFDARAARAEQEDIVARTILLAAAEGARVKCDDLDLGLSQQVTRTLVAYRKHPVDALLDGEIEAVTFNRHGCAKLQNLPPFTGELRAQEKEHRLLYPGSFNPLHWGHTELARVASAVVQAAFDSAQLVRPVVLTYEVAISRVGKQDFCKTDLLDHLQQFTSQGHRVALTTAKLFVDKARLFPNHGLLVGIDTVVRVLDKSFYDDSHELMLEAMKQIRSHGCYFVVGGRVRGEEWADLAGVDIPKEIADMFIPIPKELFRVDISSTEIRKRRSLA